MWLLCCETSKLGWRACQAVMFSRYSLPARQTCCHEARDNPSNHRDTSTTLLVAGIMELLVGDTPKGPSSRGAAGITEELARALSRVGNCSMASPSAAKVGSNCDSSGCLITNALKARTPRVKAEDSRAGNAKGSVSKTAAASKELRDGASTAQRRGRALRS